eukprot:365707-Chlamydomonas_euryale.AAC.5
MTKLARLGTIDACVLGISRASSGACHACQVERAERGPVGRAWSSGASFWGMHAWACIIMPDPYRSHTFRAVSTRRRLSFVREVRGAAAFRRARVAAGKKTGMSKGFWLANPLMGAGEWTAAGHRGWPQPASVAAAFQDASAQTRLTAGRSKLAGAATRSVAAPPLPSRPRERGWPRHGVPGVTCDLFRSGRALAPGHTRANAPCSLHIARLRSCRTTASSSSLQTANP